MALGLQHHSGFIFDYGLVLDSGHCAVEFLGRYVFWLCLSCGGDVLVRVGAVACVTFRPVFCLKVVLTIAALLCHRLELLLQHIRVSIWGNPHRAVHWWGLKQNILINIHHLFSLNCNIHLLYSYYPQPQEKDIEIQTVLVPSVQTLVETEVQHI